MRAHFAGEVVSTDNVDRIEQETLEARIDDFKRDSKNMEALTEFIDDVLQKAEAEALKQQLGKNGKAQQSKEKSRQSFAIPDFKNGKVVNRARGLVVRIFDAICNCANTAAAPAQRIKLRGKAAAGNAGPNNSGTDVSDKTNIKDKSSKKQDSNSKDKKDDKKKDELDK